MPDNLEELERDWPQRHPKNLSPQAFTRMYVVGAIVMAALVNLEAGIRVYRWHSGHPTDPLWVMPAFTVFVALQFPWLFSVASYRQTKKLATRVSVSSEMMQQIRHQGTYLVFWVYLSINMLLTSMDLMRR
jgi:hypothetical protein